ncbi:MAG: hypothetical protein MUF20_00480 [Methylotetracoccus sp.]|nr:hypothetical protein [Methylotetracoccus sp.]
MDVNRLVASAAERCARHPYVVLSFALLLSVLSGLAVARLPVYTSRQALLLNGWTRSSRNSEQHPT